MEKRTKEVVNRFVELITSLDGIAPVKFSIGYTVDGICREGLVVEECPPIVINKLVENGFLVSLQNGRLHVDFLK